MKNWVDRASEAVEVVGLVLGMALFSAVVTLEACGGETTAGSATSSPTTCRDEAHREQDVNLVVCAEHARIERDDGWIVCRCTPAPSTGGTP